MSLIRRTQRCTARDQHIFKGNVRIDLHNRLLGKVWKKGAFRSLRNGAGNNDVKCSV